MNIVNFRKWLEGEVMDEDVLDEFRRHADGSICKAKSSETCPFEVKAEKSDSEISGKENSANGGKTPNETYGGRLRSEMKESVWEDLEDNHGIMYGTAPKGIDDYIDDYYFDDFDTCKDFGEWKRLSAAVAEEISGYLKSGDYGDMNGYIRR